MIPLIARSGRFSGLGSRDAGLADDARERPARPFRTCLQVPTGTVMVTCAWRKTEHVRRCYATMHR